MPHFLNFANALIHSPKTEVLDGAVLEELFIDEHRFELVVSQPLQRPVDAAPWRLRYAVQTNHPVGEFEAQPEHLASAIRQGFPFTPHILEAKGGDAGAIALLLPTEFEFTDHWESLLVDGVAISIRFKHGFDEELGDIVGFSLAIRKDKERFSYPIDKEAVALAVENSEMIFGYALDWAPDAAEKISAWLGHLPGVRGAYLSDVERMELGQLPNPPPKPGGKRTAP